MMILLPEIYSNITEGNASNKFLPRRRETKFPRDEIFSAGWNFRLSSPCLLRTQLFEIIIVAAAVVIITF